MQDTEAGAEVRHRVALGVEYDGSAYCGWERQKHCLAVQSVLESGLACVADAPVATICAGRTDAGVHACGQVVHFDTSAERPARAWIRGTNAVLPRDVRVTWAHAVSPRFHARFSALRRCYRYLIVSAPVRPALLTGRVTWVHTPLDAQRMQAAASHLVGAHDFSAYRASGCQARSPVRTVFGLEVRETPGVVVVDVCANAFLQHMVRNIVGVLLAVGRGARDPVWAKEVLESRDRRCGGVTAPAEGLYLMQVSYPEQFAVPLPGEPALLLPPVALW